MTSTHLSFLLEGINHIVGSVYFTILRFTNNSSLASTLTIVVIAGSVATIASGVFALILSTLTASVASSTPEKEEISTKSDKDEISTQEFSQNTSSDETCTKKSTCKSPPKQTIASANKQVSGSSVCCKRRRSTRIRIRKFGDSGPWLYLRLPVKPTMSEFQACAIQTLLNLPPDEIHTCKVSRMRLYPDNVLLLNDTDLAELSTDNQVEIELKE